MSQVNNLVNSVKAGAETTSSVIGVSAANANLAAVASVLYGMQISGYEIIDPQFFAKINELATDFQAAFDKMDGAGHNSPIYYHTSDLNSFGDLIDPSSILGSDDFVFELPLQSQLTSDEFRFSELILSEDSLFDPSQPILAGDELVSSNNEEALGSEDSTLADFVPENLGAKDFQPSLPKGISSAFSNTIPSSPLTGGAISSNTSGGAGTDTSGGVGTDTSGGTGTDTSGGTGTDTSGGTGTDTSGGTGTDTSGGTGSDTSNEPVGLNLQSAGIGDVVYGGSYADTLFGSSSGGDILVGGSGDDIYMVYNSTTVISENNNEGSQDIAYFAVSNYSGTNGIERVAVLDGDAYSNHVVSSGPYASGLDSGWKINGSSDAQTISGSYGADILRGGGGIDLLIGGLGDDVYFYTGSESILESNNSGRDIVISTGTIALSANVEVGVAESQSTDLAITGNDLDNLLVGNSSANTLSGGLGADTLVGNGGDDVLIGGVGSDVYVLNGEGNFLGEISDFQSGEDRIFISYSDPSITLSIAPEDGFSGISGEVMVDGGTLQVDWNGDSQADSLLLINEVPLLSDLFLIDPNQISYF